MTLCSAGAVALAVRLGWSWCTPGLAVWAAGLGWLAGWDVHRRVLPTRLVRATVGATAVGLMVAASEGDGWARLAVAMVSGVAAEAAFAVVALVWPAAYGFGDVRVVGLLGLGVGWVAPSLVVVAIGGGLAGLVVTWLVGWGSGRMSRQTSLPLGAFLAVAGVVTVAAAR